MSKKRSRVELTEEERAWLEQVVRDERGKVAKRARVLLLADEGPTSRGKPKSQAKIGAEVDMPASSVHGLIKKSTTEGVSGAVNRRPYGARLHRVTLTEEDRDRLTVITNDKSTDSRFAAVARYLLDIDEGDPGMRVKKSLRRAAKDADIGPHFASIVREHYVNNGLDGLLEAVPLRGGVRETGIGEKGNAEGFVGKQGNGDVRER